VAVTRRCCFSAAARPGDGARPSADCICIFTHQHHLMLLLYPSPQVIHIRNLPPDATEGDVEALCKPYGRIVRTRLNAGAIKHQAFVEFENVNQAIQMIYSFVGASADPPKVGLLVRGVSGAYWEATVQQPSRLNPTAPLPICTILHHPVLQVRNKTVYLQYSTRQEISTGGGGGFGGGGGGDGSGVVILIIMDGINVRAGLGSTACCCLVLSTAAAAVGASHSNQSASNALHRVCRAAADACCRWRWAPRWTRSTCCAPPWVTWLRLQCLKRRAACRCVFGAWAAWRVVRWSLGEGRSEFAPAPTPVLQWPPTH
jgi:hypothetical protein